MSKGIAFQTSQATSASQVGIRIGKGDLCVPEKQSLSGSVWPLQRQESRPWQRECV